VLIKWIWRTLRWSATKLALRQLGRPTNSSSPNFVIGRQAKCANCYVRFTVRDVKQSSVYRTFFIIYNYLHNGQRKNLPLLWSVVALTDNSSALNAVSSYSEYTAASPLLYSESVLLITQSVVRPPAATQWRLSPDTARSDMLLFILLLLLNNLLNCNYETELI